MLGCIEPVDVGESADAGEPTARAMLSLEELRGMKAVELGDDREGRE